MTNLPFGNLVSTEAWKPVSFQRMLLELSSSAFPANEDALRRQLYWRGNHKTYFEFAREPLWAKKLQGIRPRRGSRISISGESSDVSQRLQEHLSGSKQLNNDGNDNGGSSTTHTGRCKSPKVEIISIMGFEKFVQASSSGTNAMFMSGVLCRRPHFCIRNKTEKSWQSWYWSEMLRLAHLFTLFHSKVHLLWSL